MHSKCVANVLQMHRKATAWQEHGKCDENAWPTHGNCRASAWQTHCKHIANLAVAAVAWPNTAWQLHGSCMANPWRI